MSGRTVLNLGLCGLGLAAMGVAAYLSLRASPALSTVGWLPKAVAHWADAHGRFDNFPAYGLLGLPFFLIVTDRRRQLGVFVLLTGFIVVLELSQRAIPSRHCDGWDVLWGGLGLLAGWALMAGLQRLWLKAGSTPAPAP